MSNVTVYTQFPVISWASGVTGAGTIFVSGTSIDSTLLTAVQSAATTAGVTLSVGATTSPPDNALLTKSEADLLYEPIGTGPLATIDGGSP